MAERGRLNFGVDFTGRESVLQTVINNYSMAACGTPAVEFTPQYRCACVRGVHGIGKTAFLSRLKEILCLQCGYVYYAFGQERAGAVQVILKQLVDAFDTGNDPDFTKWVLSFANGVAGGAAPYDKNSVIKYIYDCVKGKHVLFIIDDLDKADDFTIYMLEKLMMVNEKLSLIFTCANGFDNAALTNLIKYRPDGILDIELEPLSLQDTEVIVQNALNLPVVSQAFIEALHKTAGGNPLFTEEILRSLQAGRILRICESDGKWHINYMTSEHGSIPMPASIEQAVKEQADSFDAYSNIILTAISVFNHHLVSETELNRLLPGGFLQERLKELINAGILYTEAGETGIRYGFVNKSLRNYIYGKAMPHELHVLAADILMESGGVSLETMDETMYHLKKTGQTDQLLKYYIKSASGHEQISDFDQAARKFKSALEISRTLDKKATELDILLKLGTILVQDKKITQAIDILNQAQKLAEELELADKRAAASCELTLCHYSKMEYDKSREYSIQTDAFFYLPERRRKNYDLYLKHICVHIKLLTHYGDTELISMKERQALEICRQNDYHFMCRICINMGYSFFYAGDIDKALEYYSEARILAEKAKSINELESIMNAIAVCNRRKGQYTASAAMYEELIKKTRRPFITAQALNNYMGTQYYLAFDARKAVQNLQTCLDMFILTESDTLAFRTRASLVAIYLDTGSLVLAKKNLDIMRNMPDINVTLAIDKFYLYHTEALFWAEAGDSAKFEEFAGKALDVIGNSTSVTGMKRTISVYTESIKIMELAKSCDEPGNQVADIYEKVKELVFAENENAISCNEMFGFVLTLRRAGFLGYVPEQLAAEAARAADFPEPSPFFEVMLLYIQSLNKTGEEKLAILNNAFIKASEARRYLLLAYICEDLSRFYEENSGYRTAHMARYREAVRTLLQDIPKEFHSSFTERHGLLLEG
ncbi:MAG: AAA family ATPase [Defluviitaleaceae bacterium]|nr:AAA family ATPase [Defluviitaleaceae bacterium]MCL2836844.1 AAA family ATPase [Defluviitaleaceae bacterium]